MSTTQSQSPDLTRPPAIPAEVGHRAIARLLDHLLLIVVSTVVVLPVSVGASLLPGPADFVLGAMSALAAAALTVGYFTVLEARDGRTLGKRLLGIRVLNHAGRTPSTREALRRNLWTGLGALAVLPLVGGYLAGIATLAAAVTILLGMQQDSPHRRGWHDRMAGGTRVVRDSDS